jgi:hypothetical protein
METIQQKSIEEPPIHPGPDKKIRMGRPEFPPLSEPITGDDEEKPVHDYMGDPI